IHPNFDGDYSDNQYIIYWFIRMALWDIQSPFYWRSISQHYLHGGDTKNSRVCECRLYGRFSCRLIYDLHINVYRWIIWLNGWGSESVNNRARCYVYVPNV